MRPPLSGKSADVAARSARAILRTIVFCCAILVLPPAAATSFITHTGKPFEEVLEDLEFAIGELNFRIVGRNDISKGVREAGRLDFPRSLVLQVCSLALAEEALELDPALIVHMPCRIAVYERGGRVFVGTDLLPEDESDPRRAAFARKVNETLRAMVRAAAQ